MSGVERLAWNNQDIQTLAASWIKLFSEALENGDIDAFLQCIHPEGWFRDLLTFGWDFKTCHGHDSIRSYISKPLTQVRLYKVTFDPSLYGRPQASELGPGNHIIQAVIEFETPTAFGRGHVRLLYPEGQELPKAVTLLLSVSDWKGHEESGYESGLFDGHNLSWREVYEQRRDEIQRDPHVIIFGGGQSGLQVAARFRQMNIKSIVVEQTARVGDVWRTRYPTLALHTPRKHHSFLYSPFPSNWPKFTSKDKMANWMEQYAENQELVVWTSSTLDSKPVYDRNTKKWNVAIRRNGITVVLHPSHLVFAIGIFGDPNVPSLTGVDDFRGDILHSSVFTGGQPFSGKRVIVVGAGNTSADICQDLVYRGAASVTMLQRSATSVLSDKLLAIRFDPVFAEDRPIEYSDLASAGLPINCLRELNKKLQPLAEEFDKELHNGLKKAGFKLTNGPDHSGQLLMVYDRGGGYFIDVGCAPLIISGKIKVKQGTEIDYLEEEKVVFKDGSKEAADGIILATGWQPVRGKFRKLLGDDIVDCTPEMWGVGEDGELRAGYRASGYPGLWFAAGDFHFCRFYSKLLALQIKAIELGYLSQ